MSSTKYILQTKDLNKSYGRIHALKDVSVNFSENRIYGLFGRNGAGKTTLLDIIASRIYADRGNVTCYGKDILEHPGVIADNCCYMPEKHYFPPRFRLRNLLTFGQMTFPDYNRELADRLCRIFKLNTAQRYEQLSRGHQSLFRIVLGLASQAGITIFDEPVLGLDAVARDRFYSELIDQFSHNPRLFIISTHFIEEAADLFSEAIIINNGQVISQASVDDLLANAFYVSGKSDRVDEFIKGRKILGQQVVNDLKTAVVEGHPDEQSGVQGLNFSTLSMQKLFIHLTSDDNEQEL